MVQEMLSKDSRLAIEKSVVFTDHLNAYSKNKGLMAKERVGDIVMPSNNIDQIIDMVTRHYKKMADTKKGNREVREL